MEPTIHNEEEDKQFSIAELSNLKCELTTEAINEWFKSIGIQTAVGMSVVQFRIEGETYSLHTDILPLISLVKRYELEPDDEDIFVRVMQETDKAGRLAKAVVERDDDGKVESLMFQVSWLEGSIDHFKEVIKDYLGILENAIESSRYYYKKFSEEKKNEKTAQVYTTIENN